MSKDKKPVELQDSDLDDVQGGALNYGTVSWDVVKPTLTADAGIRIGKRATGVRVPGIRETGIRKTVTEK